MDRLLTCVKIVSTCNRAENFQNRIKKSNPIKIGTLVQATNKVTKKDAGSLLLFWSSLLLLLL